MFVQECRMAAEISCMNGEDSIGPWYLGSTTEVAEPRQTRSSQPTIILQSAARRGVATNSNRDRMAVQNRLGRDRMGRWRNRLLRCDSRRIGPCSTRKLLSRNRRLFCTSGTTAIVKSGYRWMPHRKDVRSDHSQLCTVPSCPDGHSFASHRVRANAYLAIIVPSLDRVQWNHWLRMKILDCNGFRNSVARIWLVKRARLPAALPSMRAMRD